MNKHKYAFSVELLNSVTYYMNHSQRGNEALSLYIEITCFLQIINGPPAYIALDTT